VRDSALSPLIDAPRRARASRGTATAFERRGIASRNGARSSAASRSNARARRAKDLISI